MTNLAREFARHNARKEIENVTSERFEQLKKWALLLFDQNVMLQSMAEDFMAERLGIRK